MSNVKKDAEVIQLSIYCDIMMSILKKKEKLSVNKLITFSYLLKKNNYYNKDVFNGKNAKGLVIKALSLLNGLRDDYFANITYAFSAIDLLVVSGKVKWDNEIITIYDDKFKSNYIVGLFFQKAIEASDLYTDRQFLKEVLNNV